MFGTLRLLRPLLGGLLPADDTELDVVSTALAVPAPEPDRARLIALIANPPRSIPPNVATRSIILDGRQNPSPPAQSTTPPSHASSAARPA